MKLQNQRKQLYKATLPTTKKSYTWCGHQILEDWIIPHVCPEFDEILLALSMNILKNSSHFTFLKVVKFQWNLKNTSACTALIKINVQICLLKLLSTTGYTNHRFMCFLRLIIFPIESQNHFAMILVCELFGVRGNSKP